MGFIGGRRGHWSSLYGLEQTDAEVLMRRHVSFKVCEIDGPRIKYLHEHRCPEASNVVKSGSPHGPL